MKISHDSSIYPGKTCPDKLILYLNMLLGYLDYMKTIWVSDYQIRSYSKKKNMRFLCCHLFGVLIEFQYSTKILLALFP